MEFASVTSVILMTSPPALEQNSQFLHLAGVFRRAGLGVPAVLAVEEREGWFLLEDLGTRHFADLYGTGTEDAALAAALESLLALQRVSDALRADVRFLATLGAQASVGGLLSRMDAEWHTA